MGTTANNAFPYPEPADLVTQGAAAIQALAEALDQVLDDSGWVNVVPNAPWLETEPIQYRRDRAGNTHLRGLAAQNGAAVGSVLFTLPAGFRPSASGPGNRPRVLVGNTTAGGVSQLDVDPLNGDVIVKHIIGAQPQSHYIHCVFPADA